MTANVGNDGIRNFVEYTWWHKGFAMIFLSWPLLMIPVWFNVDDYNKIPVHYIICGTGALSIPMAVETFGTKILWDEDRLISETWWTGRKEIEFTDLNEIKYSIAANWHVIYSIHGVKIRISDMMTRAKEIVQYVKSKIKSENCLTSQ